MFAGVGYNQELTITSIVTCTILALFVLFPFENLPGSKSQNHLVVAKSRVQQGGMIQEVLDPKIMIKFCRVSFFFVFDVDSYRDLCWLRLHFDRSYNLKLSRQL